METPAIPPTRGAHIPAAETTSSVWMSPWLVRTAVMRPFSMPKPVTLTLAWKDAPLRSASRAMASAGLVALMWMSDGTWSAPRMRSESIGMKSRASPGLITWASIPQLMASPALRLRSARRSGVQATSRLPTGLAHLSPSSSMLFQRSTV